MHRRKFCKFMFYWGTFWAAWCLGCFIRQVSMHHYWWAMTLLVCINIDAWVAYLGYRNGYGNPDS
jgi:hypothetical protein